jgi:hypothetical protein
MCKNSSLPEPIHHQEEFEETKGKLLVVLDELELHWRMLSLLSSLRKMDTLLRALLRSLPSPKNPLGESPPRVAPLGQDLIENGGSERR